MKLLLLVFRAFQMKRFFGAENHVTRETVLQLADIAGPAALLQELQHFPPHRARVTLVAAVELLPQILDEIWNIVATIAQWRKRDTDHVDAIEKVGPEPARFDFAPQLSVGCADHARIHSFLFVVADACKMAVLQNVQQLCLQAPVELGDLIQEKGPSLRELDEAGFRGVRPGERSLLESEQLAFEQRAWNRWAIHLYERAFPPGRTFVNEARQHLFAGAAFAEDQNRDVQACGAQHLLPHRLHRLGRSEINVLRR